MTVSMSREGEGKRNHGGRQTGAYFGIGFWIGHYPSMLNVVCKVLGGMLVSAVLT